MSGYTYKISWTSYNKHLGMRVSHEFRTTDDAVKGHLAALLKKDIADLSCVKI